MSTPKITIYTPESQVRHPGKMLRAMFKDLALSQDLAWRLAVRDISAQYRQTFLGLAWAFIMPVATTLTWIFLSGSGIISVGATALPYPVYVFTGTMLWSIFMDSLNAPLAMTNASRSMLAKVNFPREALIVAGIYKVLFNGGIKVGLLILALLVVGIYPSWSLLLFPLGLLSLILVGTAIGLFLTPVGTLYTDVGNVIGFAMQFLMYITPVVFPMPKEGWVEILFRLNPMTPLILTTRDWLTGYTPEYWISFILFNVFFLFFLLAVWMIYRVSMPIIIERMSS
ncbi:ABC transporter permease [Desulfobulbus alkaliphilus]|uniref:ABC transporter permease n=1 Tax=Desulfobulbus alkaliphilus TaxID=869814 RepID=UPI0019635E4E|nr:ABC transporter permease [Desulfobulbus alkaliphilus]MBM9538573.1 ABC transporter permease [Desulfobulbus alkaliphilus]